MKLAFAAILVGMNVVLWEGCSSSNGTTTSAPTTNNPTSQAPTTGAPSTGSPTTGGPTSAPGPAPNGVYVFNGTVPILGEGTGEVQVTNSPSNQVSKLILGTRDPYSVLLESTAPIPFHMEGNKVILESFDAFPPLVQEYVRSASITFASDANTITISITTPFEITVTLEHVSSNRRLLRLLQ